MRLGLICSLYVPPHFLQSQDWRGRGSLRIRILSDISDKIFSASATEEFESWLDNLRDRKGQRPRTGKMTLKLTPFDAAKYIETAEDQADLLNDALQTGHVGYIAAALGAVARARGMTELAERTGLNRQALYEALSANGNPTLDTIMRVSAALGFELRAAPANENPPTPKAAPRTKRSKRAAA